MACCWFVWSGTFCCVGAVHNETVCRTSCSRTEPPTLVARSNYLHTQTEARPHWLLPPPGSHPPNPTPHCRSRLDGPLRCGAGSKPSAVVRVCGRALAFISCPADQFFSRFLCAEVDMPYISGDILYSDHPEMPAPAYVHLHHPTEMALQQISSSSDALCAATN